MKTNVVKVDNTGNGVDEALREAERYAEYQHFSAKDALRTRLLAEEMMGMVRSIVGQFDAEFWVEGEDKEATLCLEAETIVDYEKKEKLLAASTSGRNYAERSFMGKVAGLIEYCVGSYEGLNAVPLYNDYMIGEVTDYDYDRMWSLSSMRGDLENHLTVPEKKAEWDELEKSIVAKLADEVIVGVKARKVQLIIKKSFRA